MILNYLNWPTLPPAPQAETWKTVCIAPGLPDIPSPLQAAANPHGLQHMDTVDAEAQTDTFHTGINLQKVLER